MADGFRSRALALSGLVVVLGAAPGFTAQAQERDFCAARPGKGAPACILDAGRWQVELGLVDFARQTDSAGRSTTWTAGDMLIRRGVGPATELQLGIAAYGRERTTERGGALSQTSDGVGDLSLGFAHSLRNPDGLGLAVAVSGYVSLPVGSPEVTAGVIEGGVVVPISAPLNADWSLSLSPGVDMVADADGEGLHAAYALAAGVGRTFGAWALGGELWVSRDEDPQSPTTQATLDLTAVWTPPGVEDAQIDFGVNFGLNDDSPDIELGLGVAKRF